MMNQFHAWLAGQPAAKRHPVRLVFVPTPTGRLMPDLLAGRGDVAAGLLTVPPPGSRQAAYTRPLFDGVNQVVVRHETAAPVRAAEDLSGKEVHVLAGTSQARNVRDLSGRLVAAGRAPVRVVEHPPPLSREDLFHLVEDGAAPYAVVNDFLAELFAPVMPRLRVEAGAVVARDGAIAWAVRPDSPKLLAALDSFLQRRSKDARVTAAVLFRRYYGSVDRLRAASVADRSARLGEHASLFQQAGEKYGFDWMLLGAQGYQESGLDPAARNPSGAVGLMQVLPSTAASMGFPDVSSNRANVLAGAAYLAHLRSEWFDDPAIPDADRIYFSLAAYNAGPGAMQEIRRKARRTPGVDPDRWFGEVEMVARRHLGEETVRYVAGIHRYYVMYRLLPEFRGPAGAERPSGD
jgi:membrane-bound lytic murein transglycosylase MltF